MKKTQYQNILILFLLVAAIGLVVVFLWRTTDRYTNNKETLDRVRAQYFSSVKEDVGDERQFAIQKLLHLASELYHQGKPMDVEVSVQDRGADALGVYTFCHPADRPDLAPYSGPDWCCYWWKSANITNYLETARSLEKIGQSPPLTRKAGWVGNIHSPLPDVPEFKTRPLLQTIAQKNPSLLEVSHVPPTDGKIGPKIKDYMTLEDQVRRYACLVDIGGNGYSGRLKLILWSGRPVLLVERRYIEYFFQDLVPYRHYIPVKEDLRDLVQKLRWCHSHPEEASQIGRNALQFAKEHFTLEKILYRVFLTATACRNYKASQKKP